MTTEAKVDVLVLEDDLDTRELMGMTLERNGCSVLLAADAAEALEILSATEVRVVFIDLGLPDMRGDELAARLREEGTSRGARLVALTGSELDAEACAEGTFDEVCVKPILPSALFEVVKRARATAAG